jgi:hypothetical protein
MAVDFDRALVVLIRDQDVPDRAAPLSGQPIAQDKN